MYYLSEAGDPCDSCISDKLYLQRNCSGDTKQFIKRDDNYKFEASYQIKENTLKRNGVKSIFYEKIPSLIIDCCSGVYYHQNLELMYQLAELSTICKEFNQMPSSGGLDDQNYCAIFMIMLFRKEIDNIINLKQALSYNE